MSVFAQADSVATLGSDLTAWDYGQAAIVFLASIVIARIVRMLVKRAVERSNADDFLGDLFGRLANYVIVAIGIIYALDGLGVAVAPLLGALGIAGIAIAFALQDILENFIAGIMLQLRRPFTSGDEIESGDHEGTVTSVDARTVTIRTPDGETIRIPSAAVMKNSIVNHTEYGMRRSTVEVGVAYDTDLTYAARIAVEAAVAVDGVHATPAPEALVHTFGPSSIDMAVRFWHGPSIATHWKTRDAVARSVAREFGASGIDIPFPQRVLHGVAVAPSQDPDLGL